jgi:CrcB protein
MQLLLIAAAGAVGTLARYGLTHLVQRHAGLAFPWGTFVVNVAGCLAFGIGWSLIEQRAPNITAWRAVVLVGLLGGFTTFSSFAFEAAGLLRQGMWWLAALHVVGQNVLGVLAVFAGLALGRMAGPLP